MAKKIVMSTMPKPAPTPTADQWVESRTTVTTATDAGEATKRLTLDLPESLHRRIKAQCALDGRKMVDVIREMLEERFPEK